MPLDKQIKHFIKKIRSSSNEKSSVILDDPLFVEKLEKIWFSTPHENQEDIKKKDIIWKRIDRTVNFKVNRRLQLFSYAASILVLIMGISIVYLLSKDQSNPSYYIHKVGHQTTDIALLPDGTKVVLGAESKISYPERFNKKERVVELSGQAFFYVEKENIPFIVKTDKIDISVLGTEFEVFSYDSDKHAEVTLLSGKVVVTDKERDNYAYSLSPNDRISLKPNQSVNIDQVNANQYTIWREKGSLSFTNEKLENIIYRLEKWYGRTIKCNELIANTYRFTFTIHDETLIELLNILVESSNLTYSMNKNEEYIITLAE